jgi:AcrR family transcriptional regulator
MNHSSVSQPKPRTKRGERTRERLLEAAEAVFGRLGFEKASISEITREAGVGQGTFYLYFPDKVSCFVELVQALSRRLKDEIREAITTAPDRLAAERVGFRAFFEFVARHRALYRIVRQAEFVDEAVYREYYHSMAAAYRHGLEQAMKRGEIRPLDPLKLAYCLMGIADMLGMRWVLWEEDPPVDELVETAMDLIENGLAPRGGSPT